MVPLYSSIDGCDTIIQKAHKLRNTNPLSHASSELLDKESTTVDLMDSIKELRELMCGYVSFAESK